jgi:acyl dehydratase
MTATTIEVGTVLPALTVGLSRADLVRYAGASGDFNPIHWSDRAAAALGLPGVIAHGMLTMGTALRIVTDWVGDPARIVSYATRFTKPVIVPDDDTGAEVRFTATVSAVADGIATISVEALSVDADGAEVKVLGATRVEVRLED